MSLCLVYRLQKFLFDLRNDGFIEHNEKKKDQFIKWDITFIKTMR